MNWVFDLPNVLHGNILNDLRTHECLYYDGFQENCDHCPGSRLRKSQCVGIPLMDHILSPNEEQEW